MGIFVEINYVCFMLKAKTEQEQSKANEIIKKLRYNFGKEAITTKPLSDVINVEVANGVGWITTKDKQHDGKDTLFIQVNDKNGTQLTTLSLDDLESVTRL